jgi:hypothetical protein
LIQAVGCPLIPGPSKDLEQRVTTKPLCSVHSSACSLAQDEYLEVRRPDFEVCRRWLVPLIEYDINFVDFFVEHELTWPLVGFVARIEINMDGNRHLEASIELLQIVHYIEYPRHTEPL